MQYESHKWVVVRYPGTNEEEIERTFFKLESAVRYVIKYNTEYTPLDVMKRLPSGVLTTVY